MERARRASRVVIVGLCLAVLGGCAELMQPTARVTSAAGPDIQQATLEPYDGPKARIAVSRFVVKAAKAYGAIGDGLADMLATALFQSNRYVVLERQALSDVLAEQDLGASGRVRAETAAAIGRIEGADCRSRRGDRRRTAVGALYITARRDRVEGGGSSDPAPE
jgi:curli biogenesis system outer membrane secretion channel CsgG